MTGAYNLLDEPWIPVRYKGGETRDVGPKQLFADTNRIITLAETSPPNLVALYRLLLAIVHRAMVGHAGRWKDKDRAGWHKDGLPAEGIESYLEYWRHRFWLFHDKYPFMQVAALAEIPETRDRQKPWTQISLASANGNAPAVFDHASDLSPSAISPAAAIRTLLGFLQFTPGGLVKVLRGSDRAGPLANTAAAVPLGESLGQTLCLALHPQGATEDLPAWERPALTVNDLENEALPAAGPNDRYTRMSRAVLLLREPDASVRWIRFAAGMALLETEHATDPMASYRMGGNGMVRLAFREGRAFWRDLPALLPDSTKKQDQPAAVLGYAANLHDQVSFELIEQPVLASGLSSDQAKLLRWRSERLSLPAPLLANPELANHLRDLVAGAEALFKELRTCLSRMITEVLPESDSKDTYKRARALFDAGPAAPTFFGAAERDLVPVLAAVSRNQLADADARWAKTMDQAAQQAWDAAYRTLGKSPQALRAEATAYPFFRSCLRKWIRKWTPDEEREIA